MNVLFFRLRTLACAAVAMLAAAGHAAGPLENPLSEASVRATRDAMRSALGGTAAPSAAAPTTAPSAGELRLPALAVGAGGNVAGVLEYCVNNNVLSRAAVEPVRVTLLSHVALDRNQAADGGYRQGLSGVLVGVDGRTLDLRAAQPPLRESACDYVFSSTKSLT